MECKAEIGRTWEWRSRSLTTVVTTAAMSTATAKLMVLNVEIAEMVMMEMLNDYSSNGEQVTILRRKYMYLYLYLCRHKQFFFTLGTTETSGG